MKLTEMQEIKYLTIRNFPGGIKCVNVVNTVPQSILINMQVLAFDHRERKTEMTVL